MASFRPLLGDLIGSIADVTFQRGPWGSIARRRTVPVNPNTDEQVDVRAAMATISAAWRDTLDQDQRNAWQAYADGTPWTNKWGDPAVLPGRQHFIRFNLAYQNFIDTDILEDPPEVPGLPDSPVVEYGVSAATGITLANLVIPGALSAGDWILIYLSAAPYGATRNFFNGPYRFASSISSTDIPPVTLKPAAEIAEGQRWFARAALLKTPIGTPTVGGFSRLSPKQTLDITA